MNKRIILFVSIFSSIFSSTYAPWHLRKFEYSVSDMCSYEGNSPVFEYVKPCPKNYYCDQVESGGHNIGVCKQYFKAVKTLGDSCVSDIECDSGLKCSTSASSSICTIDSTTKIAYSVSDAVSGDDYYYCQEGYFPLENTGTDICTAPTTAMNGQKCFDSQNSYIIAPSFSKLCGKKTIDPGSNNKNYQHKSTDMATIGSVSAGEFVEDEKACESGYALYFYGNKKTEKESDVTSGIHKMCVNINGVETKSNGNIISFKYSLNDGIEHSYVISQLPNDFSRVKTEYQSNDYRNLMTKLELFKKFLDKKKSIGECSYNNKYLNEPFTCGNDELRELWGYYNAPKYYLLYRNEPAIVEHLIQGFYPDYNPKYTEPQTESSGFLGIKFISLLILLLSL